MGLKVAVIGLSPTTHDLAPFNDPEWELWGLPWDEGCWPMYDRLFEMHDLRLLESPASKRRPDYMERLLDVGVPLYMQDEYFPSVTRFPFEKSKHKYWNSSIAYIIDLAIIEGAEEIAVYGVDMKGDDEYGYQKPNIEFLLGYADGKGIKITIPEQSPLMKFNPTGVWFYNEMPVYKERYGWLG